MKIRIRWPKIWDFFFIPIKSWFDRLDVKETECSILRFVELKSVSLFLLMFHDSIRIKQFVGSTLIVNVL